MKRFSMAVALLATLALAGNAVQAQTTVTWVNGAGNWFDAGWDAGAGAQSPLDVFGNVENGWRSGNGPDPVQIVIPAGSDLLYDGTLLGDLRMQQSSDAAGDSELVLNGKLTVTTTPVTDINGIWSQWDMHRLEVSGPGAHFNRINEQPDGNGGLINFGSWRSYENQEIVIDVLDGGMFTNEGQIGFGAYGDEADGLNVHMTIGENALVANTGALQNGVSNDDSAGSEGEFNFIYSFDSGLGRTTEHDYTVNFNGLGGSLMVGEEGLRVQTETEDGVWDSMLASYEDLWDLGILQAGGGNPGAFSDWFTVENAVGEADYKVTMTAMPPGGCFGEPGCPDLNGDDAVDGLDLGILLAAWNPAVAASMGISQGAVPEPTSALLLVSACCMLGLRRRA